MQHYGRTVNTGYRKKIETFLEEIEHRELLLWFEKSRAEYFVQISANDYHIMAGPRSAKHRICIGRHNYLTPWCSFIKADPEELPLERNSIDAILLTHVLEFASHPKVVSLQAPKETSQHLLVPLVWSSSKDLPVAAKTLESEPLHMLLDLLP